MLIVGLIGACLIMAASVLAWRTRSAGRAGGIAVQLFIFLGGIVGILLVVGALWFTTDIKSENLGGEPGTVSYTHLLPHE